MVDGVITSYSIHYTKLYDASAAESNRRYRYLLGQGTTGLSVAFDLPTQMGYDSASIVGSPTAVTNFSHCTVADAEIRAARTETDPEKQLAEWRNNFV